MTYGYSKASKTYASVGHQSSIEGASPHRVIQLLLESALDRIARARGHVMRDEIEAKCVCINRVVDILAHLMNSLDNDVDSSLVNNLQALYRYMLKQMFVANRDNNVAVLDEVSALFREIKSGWDAIPMSYRQGYFDPNVSHRASAQPAA